MILNMANEPKKIEVVQGDGKNEDGEELNISPVYDHLNAVKPKTNDEKKKKIIVPEEKKK